MGSLLISAPPWKPRKGSTQRSDGQRRRSTELSWPRTLFAANTRVKPKLELVSGELPGGAGYGQFFIGGHHQDGGL
jgi:hypothetical protein